MSSLGLNELDGPANRSLNGFRPVPVAGFGRSLQVQLQDFKVPEGGPKVGCEVECRCRPLRDKSVPLQ